MTTAQPVFNLRRPIGVLRGALLGGSLLGLGFAVAALVGYPAPPAQVALYWVAIILLGGCAVVAWWSPSMPGLQAATARSLSVRFGLLSGACWIVEMVTANLVPLPAGRGFLLYLIIYRGTILAGLALPLVAGFVAARATGQLGVGIGVSLWSGFISGLIGYLTLMFLTYAFMGTFQQDPQTLSQFAQSHREQPNLSLSAFIAGDSLLGSVNHLVIVGLGWGTMSGTVGALLGRALRRSHTAPVKEVSADTQ
jgi:hypothetical protein